MNVLNCDAVIGKVQSKVIDRLSGKNRNEFKLWYLIYEFVNLNILSTCIQTKPQILVKGEGGNLIPPSDIK